MTIFHGALINDTNFNSSYYSSITSEWEGIVLAVYCTIVFVFGLAGNTLVIYGTLKYRSTKYDRVTIIFVRHLAISDTVAMVIYVLPTVLVHYAGGWKFGYSLCYILGIVNILPGFLHATFIMFISLHRLIRCIRSLSFKMDRFLTARKASILSGLVFLFSGTVPLYYYFSGITIQFHVSNCVAEQDYSPLPLKLILKWIHLAEYFVIVGSVLGIAGIACYMGRGAWRNHSKILVTTFAIVVIYLLSWTPLLYSWVCMTDPRMSTLLEIPDKVYKIVIYFFMLSLVANPVIYTCINKHFKTFLAVEIRSSLGSISNAFFYHGSKRSRSVRSAKSTGRGENGEEVGEEDDDSVAASARCSEDDQMGNRRTEGLTTWNVTNMTAYTLTPQARKREQFEGVKKLDNGVVSHLAPGIIGQDTQIHYREDKQESDSA